MRGGELERALDTHAGQLVHRAEERVVLRADDQRACCSFTPPLSPQAAFQAPKWRKPTLQTARELPITGLWMRLSSERTGCGI